MNQFRGRGNLADAPALKQVTIDDEQRPVAEMRVYFDRSVANGEGVRQDKGGFWLDINLWGPRAEVVAAQLTRGARVYVDGTLIQNSWEDGESGETRTRLKLNADYIALDLSRVESIRLRPSQQAGATAGEPAEA